MNASREPPRSRYQRPCPPELSYQEHFGVPSYSPPGYQQQVDYFDRYTAQRPTTSSKHTNRIKKTRAREWRDELYSHPPTPNDYQRGELNRNFTFPMQPPSERPKIKETPRHRVEARVVESWINTEATTPEVTSLHDLEDEVAEVLYMDPMAESPPEKDGMPSRWVQVTDAQYLLLKDFQEFQRQRKNSYQHANAHIRPHGSRAESDPTLAFYNSVVARAEGSSGTSGPVHPTSSERRSREPRKSKETVSRSSSTASMNSLRRLTARILHLI